MLIEVCVYTDDVVDFIDLSMHFTVHSDPKCLGVYAEGYGTCSSKGSRLPILLSLYFVLHSNCGVIALFVFVSYVSTQISIKDGAKTYSWIFENVFVVMCISAIETTKQVENEWNEV